MSQPEPEPVLVVTAKMLVKRLAKDERRVKKLGAILKNKGILTDADITEILAA